MRLTGTGSGVWASFVMSLFIGGCASLGAMNPFGKGSSPLGPIPSARNLINWHQSWTVPIGGARTPSLAPAVTEGTVFSAAGDGRVVRIDGGRIVWEQSVGHQVSGGVGSSVDLVVVGGPRAEVTALDAKTGRIRWATRAGSEVLTPPVIVGSTIVVKSADSRLLGFDAASGKQMWIHQRPSPALSLRSSGPLAVMDGAVAVGFPGGKVAVLSAGTGVPIWETSASLPKGTTELERITDITSPPVANDRAVCVVAFQGNVTCMDRKTGVSIWTRPLSSSAGLDLIGERVVVTGEDGVISAYRIDSGAVEWRQDGLKGRVPGRPVVSDGMVFVLDLGGVLYAVSPDTGELLGMYVISGGVVDTSVTPSRSGLLIRNDAGVLTAIRGERMQ